MWENTYILYDHTNKSHKIYYDRCLWLSLYYIKILCFRSFVSCSPQDLAKAEGLNKLNMKRIFQLISYLTISVVFGTDASKKALGVRLSNPAWSKTFPRILMSSGSLLGMTFVALVRVVYNIFWYYLKIHSILNTRSEIIVTSL